MISGDYGIGVVFLEAAPVDYDKLVFAIVVWVLAGVVGLGAIAFGMWLIMTPLYKRWGAGVRFFVVMPFVFMGVGMSWYVFAFIVFPIWAFLRLRRRRRSSALASSSAQPEP